MPGMHGGHAYGVVGCNAVTDEIKTWDPNEDTFTPKGTSSPETGYPLQDGFCEMTLVVFVKQFYGLAVELLE